MNEVHQINQPTPDPDGLTLSNKSDNLVFNIENEDGQFIGTVKDSVINLHKVYGQARLSVDLNEDCIAEFCKMIKDKYGVDVKHDAGYMMIHHICQQFELKKNNIDF